jgi:hypothetical protein
MVSSWGSSWLSAWGDSWGAVGAAPVVTVRPSRGGADYRRRVPQEVPQYDDKVREKAWAAAREAEQELRRTLDDLIEGRPVREVKSAIADLQDKVQEAAIALPSLPALDDLRIAFDELQRMLAQLIRQRTIRQGEMRKALEAALRLEAQFVDDDEAMVAILMAGA